MSPILNLVKEPWIYVPALIILTAVAVRQELENKQKEPDLAIKTRKIRTVAGEEVRGIRITDGNILQVTDWLGEKGEYRLTPASNGTSKEPANERIRVRTPKGIRIAKVGDFVLKGTEPGVYAVLKADDSDGYIK